MVEFRLMDEPKTDRLSLFLNPEKAIDFLIMKNLIHLRIGCPDCDNQMNIVKSKKHLNGYIYRCKRASCNKTQLLFKNRRIIVPKIQINDYLYSIFKWIENTPEKNVCRNIKISKRTYQIIKNDINNFLKLKFNDLQKLGGKGIKVQVDETAICQENLPATPSTLPDDTPVIKWLIGAIEENCLNIRCKIINNRN